MKTKVTYGAVIAVAIVLLWLVAWGDFAEWRYSKNLHCLTYQNARKVEICKSIEKYQEYELYGHATISAGYRSSFATAQKAWCELSLTETDLGLLRDMQYDNSLPPQLMDGSGMLYIMLDLELHPNSDISRVYRGGVYDMKDSCQR